MSRQDEEALARNRFIVIGAMRAGGVAMIMFGLAVVQRLVSLPEWLGFGLIVFGMIETFVVPTLLSRIWSTNDRNPPRQPKPPRDQ